MKIDTHAHVFTPNLKLAKVRRYTPSYVATPEMFLAHLNQHGFDKGFLIQPSFLGTDNSYLLQAIQKFPNRFLGVAVIDPRMTCAEMKALKMQGIIGIRLNLYGIEPPDLETIVWKTCLRHVRELGWHVELHWDADKLLPLVHTLLAEGVKVVLDHFGRPKSVIDESFKALLQLATSTDKLWIKVSGAYRLGQGSLGITLGQQLWPQLLFALGTKRLLWGSDWPHTNFENTINYDRSCAFLEEIIPNKKLREEILQVNLDDLLRI